VDYLDKSLTKKKRMEAQLASLKLKRRTKFKSIPSRNTISVKGSSSQVTTTIALPA